MTACPSTIWWWDLSMRARCLRVGGHDGWHHDHSRWFDDYGYQQPTCPAGFSGGDSADRTAERITEGAA